VTKGDSGSDSGASVSTPHTQEKLCNKQYDTQEAPFGSTSRREHSLDRRNKHRIASPFRSTTQAPIRHRTDRRRSRAEAITRRPGKVRVPGNLQGPGQQRRRLPPKQTVRQPAGASRRRPVLHQARARQHAKGATERDTDKRDHRKGHGKKQQTEGTETEGSHQKGAPKGSTKRDTKRDAERDAERYTACGAFVAEIAVPCRTVPYSAFAAVSMEASKNANENGTEFGTTNTKHHRPNHRRPCHTKIRATATEIATLLATAAMGIGRQRQRRWIGARRARTKLASRNGPQATRPSCWTPETMQYIIHSAAATTVRISTPRKAAYSFLLHHNCSIIRLLTS